MHIPQDVKHNKKFNMMNAKKKKRLNKGCDAESYGVRGLLFSP